MMRTHITRCDTLSRLTWSFGVAIVCGALGPAESIAQTPPPAPPHWAQPSIWNSMDQTPAPLAGHPRQSHEPWANPSLLNRPSDLVCDDSWCGSPACGRSDGTVSDPCCAATVPCRRGVYGGFEFLWMRANFDQNVALVIDPPVGNTLVTFDYDYELSPRLWLGWQSARGGGFRATYFQFDQAADDESATAVIGATPVYVTVEGAGGNLSRNAEAQVGETLRSQHRLKLEALDLEATQRFEWNRLKATLSGGLRLAQMEQDFRGDVRDAGGALQEAVSNRLTFEGIGPTTSLQAHRALGARRLALYGNGRVSLLMSETDQRIYEMKGAFTTELEDAATQREVLTALELATGLQWTQPLGNRADAIARIGYECQVWFDAGGPVDSHSTISLDAITFALGLSY